MLEKKDGVPCTICKSATRTYPMHGYSSVGTSYVGHRALCRIPSSRGCVAYVSRVNRTTLEEHRARCIHLVVPRSSSMHSEPWPGHQQIK